MTALLLSLSLLAQTTPGSEVPTAHTPPQLVVLSVAAETRTADSTLVLRTAGISQGQVMSATAFRAELADAVARLYNLGLFSQVTADTTMISDGVRIVFRTSEYHKLRKAVFEGYRRLKLKDLESRTNITPGVIVSDKKVFDWKHEVTKLYKEKGYLLVRVEHELSPPDSQNQVVLTLKIDEGDPVKIRDIEIDGNESFTDPQIEVKLVNRQKEWYRKGWLKEDEFVKDLDRIVDFYKERGFLDAKVLDYEMAFDQGWARISIFVEEGTRYYFGRVSFKGCSTLTVERLRRLNRCKEHEIYNAKLAQSTLADIYGAYSEEGYIYAQVVPVEDMRNDTVDITYTITEGSPALVRLVLIEGNEQTHDKVIRREISSLPGYTFKRSEIIRSQRDIFNLGFFEDISLDYRRADTLGSIDLIYRVKEKSFFGTIGAGVSYSSPDGITGYIELQQPNLFGRGQRATVKLEKGGTKTNIQLGFTEPWLFDTPTSAGADITYLTREYDYYSKQEIGGGISVSRPLPLDYTRAYLGLRLTDSYVPPSSIGDDYDPEEGSPYDVRDDTTHKTAFVPSLTLTRDSRDYIFNATSGSAVTYTLTTSIGDIRYHRHVLDASHYFPLFWKFALMGRTRLGYIDGFTENDEVPIYDRFMPGGTGSDGIRGYPDRSIGPYDSKYYVGGKALALFSLEYKLRISPQLSFLAFADAGNTWNSFGEFNLSDLKRGAGLGVRLEIPMLGLLGFDFGYGFDRTDGGGWEPHFQIGRTF